MTIARAKTCRRIPVPDSHHWDRMRPTGRCNHLSAFMDLTWPAGHELNTRWRTPLDQQSASRQQGFPCCQVRGGNPCEDTKPQSELHEGRRIRNVGRRVTTGHKGDGGRSLIFPVEVALHRRMMQPACCLVARYEDAFYFAFLFLKSLASFPSLPSFASLVLGGGGWRG